MQYVWKGDSLNLPTKGQLTVLCAKCKYKHKVVWTCHNHKYKVTSTSNLWSISHLTLHCKYQDMKKEHNFSGISGPWRKTFNLQEKYGSWKCKNCGRWTCQMSESDIVWNFSTPPPTNFTLWLARKSCSQQDFFAFLLNYTPTLLFFYYPAKLSHVSFILPL